MQQSVGPSQGWPAGLHSSIAEAQVLVSGSQASVQHSSLFSQSSPKPLHSGSGGLWSPPMPLPASPLPASPPSELSPPLPPAPPSPCLLPPRGVGSPS